MRTLLQDKNHFLHVNNLLDLLLQNISIERHLGMKTGEHTTL